MGMVNIMDAYERAAKEANEKSPFNEIGTPQHEAWLRAFDEAFYRIFVLGEEE